MTSVTILIAVVWVFSIALGVCTPMLMCARLESKGTHTNPYIDPRDCRHVCCWKDGKPRHAIRKDAGT